MKYDLSVVMPAKRSERWEDMYKSISKSFSGTWELIIITAEKLPQSLEDKPNINLIYSERAPMQKQQIGLYHSDGDYITVVSDDSQFLPGTLDKSMELAKSLPKNTLVVLKYLEGKEFEFPGWYIEQVPEDMKFKTNFDFMRADKYYYSDTHTSSNMKGIPFHSPILSCAIYPREMLHDLGGWDCRFQSQAMGNVDLSARLMLAGYKFVIQDLVVSTCGYMEQDTGDHGPIHYAQLEDDEPLLHEIYDNIPIKQDIKIDITNWEKTPESWWRRIKPDLTVICPGIRTKNWLKLYQSIETSFSRRWEIIFIGPYPVPEEMKKLPNIRYIKNMGTPIKCQQIALLASRGKYITWAADDGVYLPGALDIGFNNLKDKDNMNLVMGKYIEGADNTYMPMSEDKYYNLKNHDASMLKSLPRDCYWMLNVGIVPRQLLIDIGGWDCQFEVCPMAYNDLAIRLQNYGVNFIIQNEVMYTCSHMPGHEGDHGPVHDGQVEHDQPLFNEIYRKGTAVSRTKIDINNWGQVPEIWERRFKK